MQRYTFVMVKGRSRFWIFVLMAVISASLFYVFAAHTIYRYGEFHRDLGWEYRFEGQRCFVTHVSPDGPAAGQLEKGDEILAINGNTHFAGLSMYRMYVSKIIDIPLREYYDATITRDSQKQTVRLKPVLTRDLLQLLRILSLVFFTLVPLVVGALVGFKKGETQVGKYFALTWLSMPFLIGSEAILPLKEFFTRGEARLFFLTALFSFAPIQIAVAYRFYYLFPTEKRAAVWTFIQYVLIAVNVGVVALLSVIRLTAAYDESKAMTLFIQHPWFYTFLHIFGVPPLVFGWLAMMAVAIRNYSLVEAPDEKRRIRWTLYGTVVGILPSTFAILLIFLSRATNWEILNNQSIRMINFIGQITLVSVIPIAVGYAVAKHRLFDINLVVRRSLHYLLAKNVLRILIYLPIVLIFFAIRANPNRSLSQIIFGNSEYLVVFVIAVSGFVFRKKLMAWLDRKYFREAYNSEQILLSLVDEVKKTDSPSQVSRLLSSQLESALHPTKILVFYRSPSRAELRLDYSSGSFHSQDLKIPANFELIRFMEMEGTPQDLDSFSNRIPGEEKQWLGDLQITMIVPLNTPDQRLIGLLLLGEKKSEQPYSATDRKMLEALAGQIAILYENWQLKERVDADQRIKREVLDQLQKEQRNLLKECPQCGTCYDSTAEYCELDQSQLELALPVERMIDEKYRLEKLLGRGGMGAVYEATDLRLLRKVAIKIMVGRMFGDHSALRRFEREARASARLNHPNIITVYDFGGIGEGAYLVMELLRGFTLRLELKNKINLTSAIAAEWFNQILEGVKAAHGQGVIHRDLKPENILITNSESGKATLKILDFGLAKVQMMDVIESKSLTSPGMALGTLSYMSPEQLAGEKVDERTDIFSLGVMVMEALTGVKVFPGETPREVSIAILQKEVVLQGDREEVRQLNLVLQKCIAKNRVDRFSSVEEMQKQLIPAISNCPDFVAHQLVTLDNPAGTTLSFQIRLKN